MRNQPDIAGKLVGLAALSLQLIDMHKHEQADRLAVDLLNERIPDGTGWRWVTDRGVRLETGSHTLARYQLLISRNFPEVESIIPADDSILLVLKSGDEISARLRAALEMSLDLRSQAANRLHRVVVSYGGKAGPDLAALAERAGLSQQDWIAQHAAAEYRVAFLGFQPGFPYLAGLPEKLRAPRRAEPRVRVPGGSLAIGGSYAGIYPKSGPGGWQIVGVTEAVLFDPRRSRPALFAPGDRVRFEAL
jgi:KipI family sensor histidine kinase inhibitor